MLVSSIGIGFWAWDVHLRALEKVKKIRPTWFSGWRRRPTQMDVLITTLDKRFEDLEARLSTSEAAIEKLEKHTDIGGGRKALFDALMQRTIVTRLTIQSARYGAHPKWKDVTTLVSLWVEGNKIDMPVENDVLGPDPYRGKAKTLEVTYTVGDSPSTHTVTVHEHDRLRLP